MSTSAEIARALCQGWLDAAAASQLEDAEFHADVGARLGQVGHRLRRVGDQWIAEPFEIPAPGSLRHELSTADLGLVALLYLHLVFLPVENRQDPIAARASLPFEELIDVLAAHGLTRSESEEAVRRVRGAGWIRRHDGRVYAATPLLAIADPTAHEAIATLLMRERLSRLRDAVEVRDATPR